MHLFYAGDFENVLDKIVEHYNEYGVVQLRGLYDNSLCDEIIDDLCNFELELEASNTTAVVTETILNQVHLKYCQGIYGKSKAVNKAFSYKLLAIASALLGEQDIYFSDLEAHLRNPGGGPIPKHQDNFYFNLRIPCALTCYIALSHQDMNTGALQYIVGSHAKVIDHSFSDNPGFSSFIQDSCGDLAQIRNLTIFSPTYEAGDVTIHHPNNIHFANPVPLGSNRGYSLSARVFPLNSSIDDKALLRYKSLLSANRSE